MYNSFNSLTLFILQRLLIAQADNWLLFCHLTSEIISTRICSVLSSIYIHMQKKKNQQNPLQNPNKALFVNILGGQCDHFKKDIREKSSL